MNANLRVHIIPVGFDSVRVTDPLIKGKADRVYLIRHNTDKRRGHKIYYDWIIDKLAKDLKSIEIKEKNVDLWNLDKLVEAIRTIITEEKRQDNHMYVNVSTGPKVAGIAGMLACMICDAEPYYVHLDYSKDKAVNDVKELPVLKTTNLPAYKIQQPTSEQLIILNLLKNGPMRKSDIIVELEKLNIIKPADPSVEFSVYAKHGQLRTILEPMKKDWGFVEIETRSKRSDVSITGKGQTALHIFGA